ncbi:3'-5' exonuclease [Chlorobium sp. N1]|uniref:3'-5' exonuclease n=1 Tax=Chlorobium sp. N1 TaxID=2491138 RepID=UPI00103F116D|nr:3'-5' exonuclease [Chlorobium sp. N1]TCD48933.1 3'-5' exonuclease [Chlorobium sp. N1]
MLLMRYALWRCGRGVLPGTVCRYLEAMKERPDGSLPLDSVRMVVFDTETTGFDLKKDGVISIGAVALNGLSIDVSDSFEVLVRQDRVGRSEAVTVHGLLKKDIARGVGEIEAAGAFLEYVGSSILVAQHASFDIAMLNRILWDAYRIRLFNGVVDTASLAKRLEKGPYYNLAHKVGEYRLDHLLERYGIRLHDRHTAAGDAYLTAQLLQRLIAKGRTSGIETAGRLLMQ